MMCEKCGQDKPIRAKGLCKVCYEEIYTYENRTLKQKNAAYQRQYRKEHPEQVSLNALRSTTCQILDKHHSDLEDDDQRLSTQYILDMSEGVKPNGGLIHDR